MSLSRRKTLALIGGGTVVAAAAATSGFVATRTPTRALQPWTDAGRYADPRHRALSYALLAPNPHNRQPWEAELMGEDQIRIFRDPSRDLPATDPHARQLTIGMGCFLELLHMAAAEEGLSADLRLFPHGEGPNDPVAEITLGPGGTPDPLFAHVFDRRSCKEPFLDSSVSTDLLDTLVGAAGASVSAEQSSDPETVAWLRDLTWRAFEIETRTPHTYKESVDLMRIGKREIEANPDGIDMGGAFFEGLQMAGLFNRDVLLDTTSLSYQEGLAIYDAMLKATPAYTWLTTPGNSRIEQIAAGRSWVRMNLAATGLGLAFHPVSQALQEYPEMAKPYAEIHGVLAPKGETVQMLGRVGYGPKPPQTPRWSLETRLKNV